MNLKIEYSINSSLDNATLLHLYKLLLKPRLIEEKMLILLRQGKISKWFSGIGQEAISVGVTAALEKEEYILPMHRKSKNTFFALKYFCCTISLVHIQIDN